MGELPKPFAVVYRRLDGERWEATIPDLPGCRAEGDDLDQVKYRIWAAGRRLMNREPSTKPSTVVGYVYPGKAEAPVVPPEGERSDDEAK